MTGRPRVDGRPKSCRSNFGTSLTKVKLIEHEGLQELPDISQTPTKDSHRRGKDLSP